MPRIRFSDSEDREDVIALGLPAGRLGLAGVGMGAALGALRAPIPAFLEGALAGLLLLGTAALVWVRWQGLSLAGWAGRAARFGWRGPRTREGWQAADGDERGLG